MDNTDLFKFEFSDRDDERKIFQRFLNSEPQKVLWVYGPSGIGKSYFVDCCASMQTTYQVIYVENCKNQTAGDAIIRIIEKLQALDNNKFILFCSKNYKGIKSLATDLISFTKLSNIKDSEFLKYILEKNLYFVDRENNFCQPANVLQTYTDKILKGKKLLFIIDNLKQCDPSSFEILLNYVKINLEDPSYKFIFICTDEENDNSDNLYEANISKNVPLDHLPLKKIPDQTFFINMLPNSFDKSNLEPDDIEKIYKFCKGIPSNLVTLLLNLQKQNAIEYYSKSIKFDREKMLKYIFLSSTINIDFSKYSIHQKIVILCIICMGVPLKHNLLLTLCKKVSQSFFLPSEADDFWNKIISELSPQPLNSKFELTGINYYIGQDLLFNAAVQFFYEQNYYQICCDNLYTILTNDPPCEFENEFNEFSKKEILANLAYHAQRSDWEKINFSCGNFFAQRRNYIQASKYFSRLNSQDILSFFNADELLVLGNTLYEVGKYKTANKIFEKIDENKVNNIYQYFTIYGKILIMVREDKKALEQFEAAIICSEKDSDNEIYAKYMKHLVMLQIPEYTKTTAAVYGEMVNQIKNAYETNNEKKLYLPSNAKVLRCCFDYYFEEKALKLYDIAEQIAKHFQDEIELAKIWHNKGFEYIRQDNLERGLEYFKKSYKILEKTKLHEAAYSINNIAICQMFQNDYICAIDNLKKALLYQKSYYLKLTATTMLMQCYRITKDPLYSEEKEHLYEVINNKQYSDPAIIRKIGMNLTMCEIADNNLPMAKKYFDEIKGLVQNSSSEYRALKIQTRFEDTDLARAEENLSNSHFPKSQFYTTMDFEPWFITLSHD